jgi:wobble nucleotide-excising tRNase
MISEIRSVKAIGKFDTSFKAVKLRKFSIVYADNGRGKSMLAAILRSLSTNNPRIIAERRTLGSTGVPEVRLLIDRSQVNFLNGKWNALVANLEVFDAAFVATNVYSGDSVQPDHTRNLYNFVLGTQGVTLAQKVSELDQKCRAKQTEIRTLEQELRRHIAEAINLKQFLKLKQDPRIDDRIDSKIAEIATLKESEAIATRSLLDKLTLPVIPLEALKTLLAKSLPDISREAEQVTLQHIADCLDDTGRNWLETGLLYVRDDICPFCGAPLLGSSLIKAYEAYFDKAYTDLKEEISQFTSSVRRLLAEDQILDVQRIIASNDTLAEFWSDHVSTKYPTISFQRIADIRKTIRSLLIADLDRKAASPLEELEPAPELIAGLHTYRELLAEILKYDGTVHSVNTLIADKKTAVSTGSLDRARKELQKLKCQKLRFRDDIAALCSDYEAAAASRRELLKQKKETKKELDIEADSLLGTYQQTINDYLERCGVGFRIVNTKTSYSGGKPRAGYCLEINAEQVQLTSPKESSDVPCFRNTLSEGDKSTLAFAFFLARLDQDPHIADKIIVFDDPASSLDANRCQFTRKQIVRIGTIAHQVIVLTHDVHLARKLWDGVWEKDKIALQITRAGPRCSVIAPCDLLEMTRGEYFANYSALADYLETGPRDTAHLRDVARSIRPLLEGTLCVSMSETTFLREIVYNGGRRKDQSWQTNKQPNNKVNTKPRSQILKWCRKRNVASSRPSTNCVSSKKPMPALNPARSEHC